jgi:imidazole glycerol phosphate synthase glutamine amidotransferase subunit
VKKNVGVVDYGMGNLHSVTKAFAAQGARVTVSSSPEELKSSELLVLPGVGSFGAAMNTLAEKNLDGFLRDWLLDDRPYLGICLGFQLLFESSEESPGVPGLGVFPGHVVKFNVGKRRVPHMGWNSIERKKSNTPYFKGIKADDPFYFVHSYYPAPADKKDILTMTDYGKPFCSSVARGRIFASQFHPEKSGEVGQRLLHNVLAS